ncbi:Flp pilus assembly protein TadG [Brevundimonas bullata]|uniref:Flp pilus assembly protein TadG n=1 Tax=Brevundimonas bullata TaxID=13160 RepID=A0A7W7N3B7_9CAUL|nr:ubiquitin-activating E1 FCCH domain-containing protein [Brevundimonas bullata]MBB4798228.1 Flp pilus assembly protein TadG [Brevundimonas bullata]MBB6383458.1 Flp pilus assembly protein TadG [Brevundimonas bullata]
MKYGAKNGLNRLARAARTFAVRFAKGTRGNVAMMFGMALPVLIMISFGAVDIHQASKVKANLQDALDAAALAAARSKYTDDVNLNRVGLAALKANMPSYFKDGSQDTASFTLNDNRITANARVNVKVLVANIVLPPYGKLMDDYLPVGSSSEVLRASRNVEVAMALDITGSMKGQPLKDLKAAASDLIDIVVQAEQTPFYSKVALVPYSMGVNVGSYANAVRGVPIAATDITDAAWAPQDPTPISTVTKANTPVVTSNRHGLTTGDTVWISGVSNGGDVNDRVLTVKVLNTNSFELIGRSNTKSNATGGSVRKCILSDCTIMVTSPNHGLSDEELVEITGVRGMTQLNDKTYQIRVLTADTFSTGVRNTSYGEYTGAGKVQCGRDGCARRIYLNPNNQVQKLNISTCVSERPGVAAFTDEAPSSSDRRVGRNYPATSGNPCLTAQITPLSSTIADLKSKIASYSEGGSTAGQIGIGWAWYMVSPRFAYLWPSASAPGPYEPQKTLKVVILMTDGNFNTPYCAGVISQDAPDDGSAGTASLQINCGANGTPFAQSVNMCDAMKSESVMVYTVGFNLGTDRGKAGIDTAIEVMEECATSKDKHFFKANSGTDLKDAFKAIGRDITRLRIAR